MALVIATLIVQAIGTERSRAFARTGVVRCQLQTVHHIARALGQHTSPHASVCRRATGALLKIRRQGRLLAPRVATKQESQRPRIIVFRGLRMYTRQNSRTKSEYIVLVLESCIACCTTGVARICHSRSRCSLFVSSYLWAAVGELAATACLGADFKSLTLNRIKEVLPLSLSNSNATSPVGSICILEYIEVLGQICRALSKVSPSLSLARTVICTRAVVE